MGGTVRRPGSDEGWRVRGRQWTARRRAGRRPAAGCVGVAVVLGLGGVPAAQAASGAEAAGGYAFAEDARRIEGAASTADAAELVPGRIYRSTLPASGKVHYRLELDSTTNTYVSATAAPPAGRDTSVIDGVRISVQDGDGRSCDSGTATFGAGGSPHPVAAWAGREISPRRPLCRDAGTYYVTVARTDPDGKNSSPTPWDIELITVSEPALEEPGPTEAPKEWNSASPRPATGDPERRPGGAGFADATSIGQGVWRDDIRPGQTLFYKVPVDWGQQLHATAELGSSSSAGGGYVAAALDLDLYNPVRGHVEDVGVGYDGGQKSRSLAPLPPVAHVNRHAAGGQVAAMRFAGFHYLVAHLSPEVADDFGDGPVPLTLRIRLSGEAQDGPGYAGRPVPSDVFTVTGEDRETAAQGGGTPDDDAAYRALAAGGIGTGSALLVGLGVWTLVARRRARP